MAGSSFRRGCSRRDIPISCPRQCSARNGDVVAAHSPIRPDLLGGTALLSAKDHAGAGALLDNPAVLTSFDKYHQRDGFRS